MQSAALKREPDQVKAGSVCHAEYGFGVTPGERVALGRGVCARYSADL